MNGPFAVRLPRDIVRVSGPDAITYLQGQLSQDIAALVVGECAWSFVLQPQGKVDAWFRVTRTAEDSVVLDVDGGYGPALIARLERFKLRVKVMIEPLPWQCVAIRGASVAHDTARAAGAEVVAVLEWPGADGVDLLGPVVAVPAGPREATLDDYQAWRVAAGMPAMGAELDEHTIPAEAGVVGRSVSFTKGCYTGQELVARVDSRGSNTPRKLRAVAVAAGAAAGDDLVVADKVVGRLTSVAAGRALAYVRREVDPPADAVVRTAAGDAPARIEALPG